MLASMARGLARSPLFARARTRWDATRRDWNVRLSKPDKLMTGLYLILSDFAEGVFPPRFDDQYATHQAEINYREAVPGVSLAELADSTVRAPFHHGPGIRERLTQFLHVYSGFEKCSVAPPARILELGCGAGWMAEFLALMGYSVCATTLSPHDVADAVGHRKPSVAAKHPSAGLEFRVSAMESVRDAVADLLPFDAVYAFEALHHAHDWRSTLRSAHACLRPGGWLLLCSEPNILHVFTSYRIAKLTHTHELGFSRRELLRELHSCGFDRVVIFRNRCNLIWKAHWLAARKAT